MIGSVYDYYLTTYAGRPATKSDTHKKSELRSVYNNIVKISKKSPLYKVSVSENIQKFAIDLKENARTLSKDATNLFEKSLESAKSQKYVSDNENVVQVKTLDNISDAESVNTAFASHYNIEVLNLATPQINTSDYLNNDDLDIPKGVIHSR